MRWRASPTRRALRALLRALRLQDAGCSELRGRRDRGDGARQRAPAPPTRRRRRRRAARRRPSTTRRCSTRERSTRWLARIAQRRARRRSTPRPTRSTRCRRSIVGVSFVDRAGRGGLHPARAPLCRRAGPARRVDAVLARLQALARGRRKREGRPEPQVRPARARQPRHRARAASRTTRCCSPTCSRRTSRTTWTASPSATSACKTLTYDEVTRQGRAARSRSSRSSVERATEYSAEDADMTLQLHRALYPQHRGRREARRTSTRRSRCRCATCCSAMERNGVLIDARAARRAEPRARASA